MMEGNPNNPGSTDEEKEKKQDEQVLHTPTDDEMEYLRAYEEQEKLKSVANSTETKTNNLEKGQEELALLYLSKMEEVNILRHEYNGLVDVIIPMYKKEITFENIDEISEKIAEAEKLLEIRSSMDSAESSLGEIFGKVSEGNREKLKTVPMGERTQSDLTPEEIAEAEAHMEFFMKSNTQEKSEWQEKSQEIQRLMSDFESNNNVEVLHSFDHAVPEIAKLFVTYEKMSNEEIDGVLSRVSADEAEMFRVRRQAKDELGIVANLLYSIKTETKEQVEALGEIRARYKLLSRALGVIGGDGKIDHTR